MQGESGKMSASDPYSAIYVTDSAKQIKDKVCVGGNCSRRFARDMILSHGESVTILGAACLGFVMLLM